MQRLGRRAVLAAVLMIAALVTGVASAAEMSAAEVAEGYLAAWNAKDVEKAASYYADDVEYFDVTLGEAHKGRDEAREVVQTFVTAAPDLKWEMKGEPIVSEDGIAFQWTFSGTNTGAWGPDTPATNKPFSFDGVTFMRVKDGKITYQGDYYDGHGFGKQLGWYQ
ncbi:MAG: hypothetical protein K0S81_2427 [Rhodospirillales bacterium]|nr:hypothetical protein [Rhodospirillales bacterium]